MYEDNRKPNFCTRTRARTHDACAGIHGSTGTSSNKNTQERAHAWMHAGVSAHIPASSTWQRAYTLKSRYRADTELM